MNRTISQLRLECKMLGIELNPDGFLTKAELKKKYGDNIPKVYKYKKEDLIKKLGDYYIKKITPSWGLIKRRQIKNLAVCKAFKDLKTEEQEEILTSPDWIAEEKINGCRVLVCYHPEEGFTFFSRDVSVKDYLPIDYSDNILLKKDGKFFDRVYFKNRIGKSFVLDCEIVAEGNIDTSEFLRTGVETESCLNATVSLLAHEPEISKKIQIEQAALKILAFDILCFKGVNLLDKPLAERIKLLEKVINGLKNYIDIYRVKTTFEDKEEFFQQIIREKGEGVVYKNLTKGYHNITARKKDVWVKRKRDLESSIGREIDAFITGYVESSPDKKWSHLIGGIKLSVFLRRLDGNVEEHHIGTVTHLTDSLREQMTKYNSEGKPELKEEYYDKVVTINGFSISPKSKRFSHCRLINNENCFRKDRTKFSCELDEIVLIEGVI